MADAKELIRSLLSLSSIELRIGWLGRTLAERGVMESAALLNGLCEASHGSEEAREALLAVVLWLAEVGPTALVEGLREAAKSQRLLALYRLMRAPGRTSSPPPISSPKVPDYGLGRELTLGERRSLARQPNRKAFERLLRDPHPLVLRQLLENPKLTESDVVRLVARRPGREEVFEVIARVSRWLVRGRVRLAIVLNPAAPPWLSAPLLGLCTRSELCQVIESVDLGAWLRATAQEYLERRPPLGQESIGSESLQ